MPLFFLDFVPRGTIFGCRSFLEISMMSWPSKIFEVAVFAAPLFSGVPNFSHCGDVEQGA